MDDDDGLYDSGERGYIHVCTVLGHGCHNSGQATEVLQLSINLLSTSSPPTTFIHSLSYIHVRNVLESSVALKSVQICGRSAFVIILGLFRRSTFEMPE